MRPAPPHETTSTFAGPSSQASQNPATRESLDEARSRMHRAELRARVNLIIFIVGITVMIAFSYLVIHFSRRR
jgi:hypothetical protein